jgi:hypothetical protein
MCSVPGVLWWKRIVGRRASRHLPHSTPAPSRFLVVVQFKSKSHSGVISNGAVLQA